MTDDTEIHRALGHIEGKLDQLLLSQTAHISVQADNHKDHEKRIRSLEQSQWKVLGGASLLAFLLSLFPFKDVFSKAIH